jgi:GMP synthase PP-ATPase subunit
MASDETQARLQRIEKEVRDLSSTVSVLAAVDSAEAKKRIETTFGSDARMVIIYRGVQRRLTQTQIAQALRARKLPGAQQARVSNAFDELEEMRFIERTRKGPPVALPGWEKFGLERVLKKTLRASGVADLS